MPRIVLLHLKVRFSIRPSAQNWWPLNRLASVEYQPEPTKRSISIDAIMITGHRTVHWVSVISCPRVIMFKQVSPFLRMSVRAKLMAIGQVSQCRISTGTNQTTEVNTITRRRTTQRVTIVNYPINIDRYQRISVDMWLRRQYDTLHQDRKECLFQCIGCSEPCYLYLKELVHMSVCTSAQNWWPLVY